MSKKLHRKIFILLFLAAFFPFASKIWAQDLDPRAYVRFPVNITFLVAGFNYTYGGVVLDQAIPITDLKAKVGSPILGAAHTFSLFGLTSQAFAVLPFCWAQASGKVVGEAKTISRSGLGDARFRISTLLLGGPAATLQEFSKYSSRTILGASLTIVAPTGQYFNDKLINLGANRWSFKPEIGLSQKVTGQWFIDLYAGVWLFTNNNSFYPGTSLRSQDPLISLQTHISYNFNPLMWAAIDFTFYNGGQSSINNVYKDDRQNNSRFGATFNLPVSREHSIKIAYSTGAVIRFGTNFSTISIAWQMAFI